jgi:hypothetical protein
LLPGSPDDRRLAHAAVHTARAATSSAAAIPVTSAASKITRPVTVTDAPKCLTRSIRRGRWPRGTFTLSRQAYTMF